MTRRRGLAGIAFVATMLSVGLATNIGGGSTLAEFTATTSNDSSFSAKRIFPGDRVTSTWDIRDAADATESNESHAQAFADAVVQKSTNWANTFQATRYLDYEMNGPFPAGLPVLGATFDFDFNDDDGGGAGSAAICIYIEVRQTSTGTVLATYGSSGSPLACADTVTTVNTSTAIPVVSSTAAANDLTIRVYGRHAGGKAMNVDLARLTIPVYGAGRRAYPVVFTDAADGTPASVTWGPPRNEGTAYSSVGNWSNNFAANRYVKFAFQSPMPGAAQPSSVTFNHSYKSATGGDTTSYYFEVYNGTSLIGTHGSTTTPVSSNATTSYVTDNVSLTEVDTAAEANNLVIKLFGRNSGSRKSLHDLLTVTVNYTLAASGCSDPHTDNLTPTADSWVAQDSAGDDNFGTDIELEMKSETAKARRALVQFGTLPAVPDGCSLSSATLRMYLNTVASTRTLDAYRIVDAWTELGVVWNNQPGTTGSPVSVANTAGWVEWTVTTQVQANYYAGVFNGFLVRDSNENSANFVNKVDSREGINPPQLVLVFG